MIKDRSDRVCVIGAGYSGLPSAYALKQAGVPYDQLEATDRVGGNWSHGVYDSTHLISSSRSTAYVEFPMPEDYPTFPSRAQMLAYLESYVDHFGLGEHLELRTEVAHVRPVDSRGMEGWYVELATGEVRRYGSVVVANGHYWERNIPTYPGIFAGRQIHSKDYKRPEDLGEGSRVLVVGGGNSGADLAVEAAQANGSCELSMRGGLWYIPKAIAGIPASEWDRVWLPLPVMRLGMRALLATQWGRYQWYGLQRPGHRIFDKDVTVNNTLLYALQHGKVRIRPEIIRFDGHTVHFSDGTCAEFDTIVWATGYNTRFPMLDESTFAWENGQPLLVQHVLAPRYANLYVWGLVAPRSGAGRILSYGAAMLPTMIEAQRELDRPLSDVVATFLPARSSILAGSAEILGRLRLLRATLRPALALERRPGSPDPAARAVVTGASSGIGAALAESLARRGHALILVARREDRLRELADRLSTRYGVAVEVAACDLASYEAREKLLVDLSMREISVLCLNAGFATYGALTRLDADREREQVEVNVVAVHDFAVRLLPAMVERGSGAVLVTGSTAGNQPSPNNATYAATKAFANTLAESLHGELKGSGVSVTLLAPGPVKTEFADVAHLGRLEDLLPGFVWVSAEQAAELAIRGMERGRRRVVPGALGKLNHVGGVYTPRAVLSPILRRLYGELS